MSVRQQGSVDWVLTLAISALGSLPTKPGLSSQLSPSLPKSPSEVSLLMLDPPGTPGKPKSRRRKEPSLNRVPCLVVYNAFLMSNNRSQLYCIIPIFSSSKVGSLQESYMSFMSFLQK